MDVLCLNEVDYNLERSARQHQAAVAADAMGAVDWRFAPAFAGEDRRNATPGQLLGPHDSRTEAHEGVALLTRIPVQQWQRLELGASPVGLPLLNAREGRRKFQYVQDEPHLAIVAHLVNGWTVVATHLSFVTPLALLQLQRLMRFGARFGERVLLIGDMNLPSALLPLRRHFRSVPRMATFPAWRPRVQFDHVLLPPAVSATGISLPALGISDHLPIGVEVDVPC